MKFLTTSLLLLAFTGLFFISCSDSGNIFVPQEKNITDQLSVTWYVPNDFPSIQDAINSANVSNGDIIIVGPGNFSGAFIAKSLTIKGVENTVINDGPVHASGLIMGFRFMAGGDNSTISNLTFTVDLDIMNGAAVNNVNVNNCTFLNAVQAVSNWRGNNWNISHNTITDLRTNNGGGIGVLIGDFSGGTVSGNIISHNTISGALHLSSGELGGYAGSGIVLYADFRWGSLGTAEMKNNFVTHNKISMLSDNPALVDIVALELTDTRDINNTNVILSNSVGFNDFRGTDLQIALAPESLDNPVNDISRNLGENRSHGLHPVNFKP